MRHFNKKNTILVFDVVFNEKENPVTQPPKIK